MRSTRYALLLASGYAAIAVMYIVLSSAIAASMSADIEQLKTIETFKGVLFVIVTAIAVFAGARFAFAHLERADAQLRKSDRAILENERRIFAGLIAASIAHDANNVLIVVIADLEELRRRASPNDPVVVRLQGSVQRLVSLNRRLLTIARRGRRTEPEDFDLVQGVEESLEFARLHEHVIGCQVRFAGPPSFVVRTHPLLLQQILVNLVVNGAEATAGRGTVEVRLVPRSAGVALEVHDDGPGVPRERRARVFDALETTKSDGSGLGLFSVKSCALALGGSVEIGDSPLGGACFRVELPAGDRIPTEVRALATSKVV